MSNGVDEIEGQFAKEFEHWGITLPKADVEGRQGGHIFDSGWHIGYVWGEDAGEEYLEYLAQHRMTNDRHVRIWASGRTERLPAQELGYVLDPDATAEEEERAREEYFTRNREIADELRALGLLPPVGGNLGAMEMNEYLRSGRDRDAEASADEGRSAEG